MVREFTELTTSELKEYYNKQKNSEQEISGKIITYVDDGADINTKNVDDVIVAIKRKMEEQAGEGTLLLTKEVSPKQNDFTYKNF